MKITDLLCLAFVVALLISGERGASGGILAMPLSNAATGRNPRAAASTGHRSHFGAIVNQPRAAPVFNDSRSMRIIGANALLNGRNVSLISASRYMQLVK